MGQDFPFSSEMSPLWNLCFYLTFFHIFICLTFQNIIENLFNLGTGQGPKIKVLHIFLMFFPKVKS